VFPAIFSKLGGLQPPPRLPLPPPMTGTDFEFMGRMNRLALRIRSYRYIKMKAVTQLGIIFRNQQVNYIAERDLSSKFIEPLRDVFGFIN
jgi:hypothetical protein